MKTDDLHQVAYVVLAWFRSDVLVLATLVQAAGALLAAGAVRLMAPRLERAAAGPISRLHTASVRRVMTAVAASTPWLLLVLLIRFEELVAAREQVQDHLLRLVESLALAWVIIRLGTGLVRNPRLSRVIAAVAWTIAALNLAGLIGPTADVLGAMAVTVGTLRISMLLLLKGVALLVVLLWLANLVSNVIEGRLNGSRDLTPAMQVLAAKLSRAGLLTLAVVFALSAVGIDLTAFAVFTGAIGVGIGFGLQKVISNLISGVILLLDRSIKPGDVIEIEGTYGWITKLNARFVSVVTRDGTEYLIPNEDLITQRVINWSYSNDLVRLRVAFGIAYDADVRKAIGLAVEAVSRVERVLPTPEPVCLLAGFGDSSVDLELRFWIKDPRNGTANVESDVRLQVWDAYHAAGIEFPFPQRDVTFKNPELLAKVLRPGGVSFGEAKRSEPHDVAAP